MANYCFSNYVVEGKIETLTRIKDAINNVNKRSEEAKEIRLHLGDILVELGLYPDYETLKAAAEECGETPEGLGIAGDWLDAKIEEINGQSVLTFREEYKWNCSCNMERLSEMEGFKDGITGVYRYSEEGGCGIYETTDSERKYFTDEYIKSLGYEPEEIDEASDMSAGDLQKIAREILK